MCCLYITGGNIADNQQMFSFLYYEDKNAHVPIIVTDNDFSTLYSPLIRDGCMEKFYWAPTRKERIGVCTGIFRTDNVPKDDVIKLIHAFPGQSIQLLEPEFIMRSEEEGIRSWELKLWGKKLVNSKEGLPTFEQHKMTLEKLLDYGNMGVQEKENVKRVQLTDKCEATLGNANEDAIEGNFLPLTSFSMTAQQVNVPVREDCTDLIATNLDPTARSDKSSCPI